MNLQFLNQNFSLLLQSRDWVGTVLLNTCRLIERPSKKDGFCFKLFHPLDQSIWGTKVSHFCCPSSKKNLVNDFLSWKVCLLFMSTAYFEKTWSWKQTLWTLIRLLLRERSDLGPCSSKMYKQIHNVSKQTTIVLNNRKWVKTYSAT